MAEESSANRPRNSATPALPLDHLGALSIGVLMMAVGWLGIAAILRGNAPTVRAVFQLLVLLFFAVSGTAMPLIFYLNVRFVPISRPVPPSAVIVRQSAWVGFFVVGCACLQLLYIGGERLLTLWSALALAAALSLMEWQFRRRETSFSAP